MVKQIRRFYLAQPACRTCCCLGGWGHAPSEKIKITHSEIELEGLLKNIIKVILTLAVHILYYICSFIIVTGFVKTCIVHISNFSTLVPRKIYQEWQMDIKLSRIVEVLFLYNPWKFQTCISLPVDFTDLRMSKIGCVNYACFPKSGHNYIFASIATRSHLLT